MDPTAVFEKLYEIRTRSALGSLFDLSDIDPDEVRGRLEVPEGGFADEIREAVSLRSGVLEDWEQMSVGTYVAEEATRGVSIRVVK